MEVKFALIEFLQGGGGIWIRILLCEHLMRTVSVLTIASLKLELNKGMYINHDREEMAQWERYYAKRCSACGWNHSQFLFTLTKNLSWQNKTNHLKLLKLLLQRFVIKSECLTSHLLTTLLKLWALSVVVGEQINQQATGLLYCAPTSTRSSRCSLVLICKWDCLSVYWNRVLASTKWTPLDTQAIQGLSFSLLIPVVCYWKGSERQNEVKTLLPKSFTSSRIQICGPLFLVNPTLSSYPLLHPS